MTIGGSNKTIYQMTDYLHEINKWSHNLLMENDLTEDDCNFVNNSLVGWVDMKSTEINSLDVSLAQHKPIILWAQIKPFRTCYNRTLFNNGIVTCKNTTEDSNACEADMSIKDFEELYGLRHDALINVTLVDEGVETTVIYNLSHTVSLS